MRAALSTCSGGGQDSRPNPAYLGILGIPHLQIRCTDRTYTSRLHLCSQQRGAGSSFHWSSTPLTLQGGRPHARGNPLTMALNDDIHRYRDCVAGECLGSHARPKSSGPVHSLTIITTYCPDTGDAARAPPLDGVCPSQFVTMVPAPSHPPAAPPDVAWSGRLQNVGPQKPDGAPTECRDHRAPMNAGASYGDVQRVAHSFVGHTDQTWRERLREEEVARGAHR